MFEKPTTPENAKEHIPSEEEILSLFEKLVEGKEYEITRKKEDEKGIYLFEIKLEETDNDGTTTEYSYARTGEYPQNRSTETAIHIAYFDSDGIPVGGHSVAKLVDGAWIETK
jgi:hypothetical protein